MPYCLVPLVQTNQGGLPSRRPLGWDESALNFILLGDRALVYLEDDVASVRSMKLAEDKAEVLGGAARGLLAQRISDRAIGAAPLAAMVVDLLRVPGANPWRALRPSHRRGRYEIWLGPGGRGNNLLWAEAVPRTPHSVTYIDSFDRSDGDIDGSTFSGGTAQWDENSGTAWQIVSNQAHCLNIPDGTLPSAIATVDVDSDDMFAQATGALWVHNHDYTYMDVSARMNTTYTNGYVAMVAQQAGTFYRELRIHNSTLLDGDSGVNSTGAVIRLECDGSSISYLVDDVVVLGPVTDASQSSGAGNRRAGMRSYSAGGNTSDVGWDDFSYGDLTVAGPVEPVGLSIVFRHAE